MWRSHLCFSVVWRSHTCFPVGWRQKQTVTQGGKVERTIGQWRAHAELSPQKCWWEPKSQGVRLRAKLSINYNYYTVTSALIRPSRLFSSVQSINRLGRRGDVKDDSAEILFQFVMQRGRCEQFWHGEGRPLFYVVHSVVPLPTKTSPTLHGALKDGFGEAVVARSMQ